MPGRPKNENGFGDDRNTDGSLVRRRFDLTGQVQGVGFRPWIYRLASEEKLAGHVGNSPAGAFIELEGESAVLERFLRRIHDEKPPLVRIRSIEETTLVPDGNTGFEIRSTTYEGKRQAGITPDTSICDDCHREMMDPNDRRYLYPFINCTNCGPRYSIIRSIPYDRVNTTMSVFTMCDACRKEYENPADRRFHAQPNACTVCGPQIRITDGTGVDLPGDPIPTAVRLLGDGRIVAIKGLGGFHLACRAEDAGAVALLRKRKTREAKPLAVMVGSVEAARRHVILDGPSERALTDPARPIVLAPRRSGSSICDDVAPGIKNLGIMLPYTPLHALIFAEDPSPLVMTSGNPSAEPLCAENSESLDRLASIADAFLLHDRVIERRLDDSVVLAVRPSGDEESVILPIRRARGYVPSPVTIRWAAKGPVLAVGGELKSTVCLLHGETAVMSEHLGDLDNPAAYRNFIGAVDALQELLDVKPVIAACDMHPGYAATRYAAGLGIPVVEVQHHHAHIVSCMADNGVEGKVVGVACDGTGYGTDGTIWGCEILLADEADFVRAGHLRPFPLPGGDAAAVDTWRPAAALLHGTFGEEWIGRLEEAGIPADRKSLALTGERLRSNTASLVRTSSLGRFFDAAAFLLGVCGRNRFEAEAPIVLESLATAPGNPFDCEMNKNDDGKWVFDYAPIVRGLLEGVRAGRPRAELAAAFHETVAIMLARCAGRVADENGVDRVLLSGGCFANRYLLTRMWELLREDGLNVFLHKRVPPGDGGISLGQAICAVERGRRD